MEQAKYQECAMSEKDPSQRIVITGMGCVSSLGHDPETMWQNLLAGKSGVETISDRSLPGFDKINTHVAAPVHDFDFLSYPDIAENPTILREYRKKLDRLHRTSQFAIWSGAQALRQAGLTSSENEQPMHIDETLVDKWRFGIRMGSDVAGTMDMLRLYDRILSDDKRGHAVPPDFLRILPERVASTCSIAFKACGSVEELSTACATGNTAIISAAKELLLDRADVMLAGGTSAALEPLTFALFEGVRASDTRNEPQHMPMALDQGAKGVVLGEGSAVLVMETLAHAREREAPIIGELLGDGETSDGEDDTRPNGIGSVYAMRQAMDRSGITPDQIGYIKGHFTGTLGDEIEMDAIAKVHDKKSVYIGSIKPSFGHVLGNAASLESLACLLALRDNILPPTLHLENPIEQATGWNLVAQKAAKVAISYVMNNAFGFGGFNAVTVYGPNPERP
jgi:3-oxoacyl-[acyl-carrier-protein] synthase II